MLEKRAHDPDMAQELVDSGHAVEGRHCKFGTRSSECGMKRGCQRSAVSLQLGPKLTADSLSQLRRLAWLGWLRLCWRHGVSVRLTPRREDQDGHGADNHHDQAGYEYRAHGFVGWHGKHAGEGVDHRCPTKDQRHYIDRLAAKV